VNTPIPLFVINLDRDIDRWDSALNESAHDFLKIHRVKAIDAHDLPSQVFVAPGVRAAWLSHMKAMSIFLESDSDIAIIAEDDFHIKKSSDLLTAINTLSNHDWDMVQFGFLTPGIDTRIKLLIARIDNMFFNFLGMLSQVPGFATRKFSSRMRVRQSLTTPRGFVMDDCQPGAHFYLVTRSFCQSISRLNNPQFLSIDDFYTALSRMRTFRMLRVKKNLVTQKPFTAWAGPRFKRSL
jgi:GR25 family glycosyltransferase involved in LPS biosynthesis